MKSNLKIIARFFIVALTLATSQLSHSMEQELSDERPHIMLYVDINRTLIVEDKKKGLGPDKSLAAILSADPKYSHTWGDDLEKRTYKKWVDEKLLPGSYQDPDLKKERESYHTEFVNAARAQNHPMFNEINHEYNSLLDAIGPQGSRKVCKSFSNLVTYLKEGNYSFSVILRTFGGDLYEVSQDLAQDGLNFINGSFRKGADLDRVSQELAQDSLNFINGSLRESVLQLHLNDRVLAKPAEMILAFEPRKHYAIQDNYGWWKQHNFTEEGGKPFPIDISDKKVLSIFFDDDANNSKRQILNVMSVGKKTNLSELIAMGRVVPVDPRKAILEGNYYIAAFEEALKKWRQ